MADISIQFHALPEELRDFVKQCVSDFGLHIIAIRFHPYEAIELDADRLDEAFTDSSQYDELAFTLHPPILPAKGNMALADNNPDVLWLAIGKRTNTSLKESHLSARTENAVAFAVWKQIAKRLKDLTDKGALAVNPETGATSLARGHRFTSRAKALETSGIATLTITGIILKLGQTIDAKITNE
jgi:hypothetical protein